MLPAEVLGAGKANGVRMILLLLLLMLLDIDLLPAGREREKEQLEERARPIDLSSIINVKKLKTFPSPHHSPGPTSRSIRTTKRLYAFC